jgi:hypothetical protein
MLVKQFFSEESNGYRPSLPYLFSQFLHVKTYFIALLKTRHCGSLHTACRTAAAPSSTLPSLQTASILNIRPCFSTSAMCLDLPCVQDSSSTIQYAAFFADCEHEPTPLTSGMRLVLTYNMVYTGPAAAAPRLAGRTVAEQQLQQALQAWEAELAAGSQQTRIAFLLGGCLAATVLPASECPVIRQGLQQPAVCVDTLLAACSN